MDRLGRSEQTDSVLSLVVVLDVEKGRVVGHGGEARKGICTESGSKLGFTANSD